ncbi:hypothetical protein GQ53DRAFT_839256 [Thozetella sp. PMI_491]|nr:hypothetical protein GQ53DRAFT_839256 [Thozetella sp. PMI_491]
MGGVFHCCLLLLLLSLLSSFRAVRADDAPDDAQTSLGAHAKVVSIFYIDERAYEGLPYTLFHRASGGVIGVDADRTTFLVTTTRRDLRPSPTHSHPDNITIPIATATGQPSTITQGPATFIFTGTRYNKTYINQCSLNGTVSAVCNLTHVGSAWYTSNRDWNGTYSTYTYNWTTGARWGFAPVTITMGAELITVPNPTASRSANAAAGGSSSTSLEGRWFVGTGLAIAAAMVLGAAVLL